MLEDELKVPYVSMELVPYLESAFSVDSVLVKFKVESSDKAIGYLSAVRDVVALLRVLSSSKEV